MCDGHNNVSLQKKLLLTYNGRVSCAVNLPGASTRLLVHHLQTLLCSCAIDVFKLCRRSASQPPPRAHHTLTFFVPVPSFRVHASWHMLKNFEPSNSSFRTTVHVLCMNSNHGLTLLQFRFFHHHHYHMPHNVPILPKRSLPFKRLYPMRLYLTMTLKLKRHCMHGHTHHMVTHGHLPQDLHPIDHHNSLIRPLLLRIVGTIRQSLITRLLHLRLYQS